MAVQRADEPTHCFPDASVSCESITLDTEKLLAHKLLVEVISRKSVMRDHVTKKYAYQAIPSLEEYVLARIPQMNSYKTLRCCDESAILTA